MFCTKCGTQYDGNFCPNCGTSASQQPQQVQSAFTPPPIPPKKKSPLKVVGIVLAVILGIGIINSIINPSDKELPASSKSAQSSNSSSKSPAASSKASSSKAQNSSSASKSIQTFGVGDTVEAYGLQFTLDSVKPYVDNTQIATDKPDDGKEFIMLSFTIKNISDEDEHVNVFFEESYCDDIAIDPEIMLLHLPQDEIWGDIASGKKRVGCVTYQVPHNWKTLEFRYEALELFSNDSAIIFVATRDDLT